MKNRPIEKCPCCGSEAVVIHSRNYKVKCPNELCEHPVTMGWVSNPKSAVVLWNGRVRDYINSFND